MKREIKFRLWDDLNKKWLLGYEMLGGFSMIGEVMIFGEYQNIINQYKIEDWDKLIFEQYTGLKDKNGKEIFEGDIMEVPDLGYKGEMTFKFGVFGIKGTDTIQWSNWEITGNIHETTT